MNEVKRYMFGCQFLIHCCISINYVVIEMIYYHILWFKTFIAIFEIIYNSIKPLLPKEKSHIIAMLLEMSEIT